MGTLALTFHPDPLLELTTTAQQQYILTNQYDQSRVEVSHPTITTMPPKKATTTTKKAAAPAHASYQDMIKEAILALKERNGPSRQAIKKYVHANNKLDGISDKAFTTQLNRAIASGSEKGVFSRPKGPSGPVKLAQPSSKAAAPAAKTTTTKKAAPAKKATTTKSTTTKSTANTSKVRKTPAAAPAVETKKAEALGKTKSGRVVKSSASQPEKKAAGAKKAATKKAAAKKS